MGRRLSVSRPERDKLRFSLSTPRFYQVARFQVTAAWKRLKHLGITMIERIGSVPIFVSDHDRALVFYRDKLGFEVVVDHQLDEDFRWVTVKPAGSQTELNLYRPVPAYGDVEELKKRVGIWTGIVFLTSDIQSTYKKLVGKGVDFEAEPSRQPWGGLETWFTDPDGNRFHLAQR